MPFLYAGICLLAGSVLLLEIALTRVFAITMWHHLAYMVISVALLGFGAAGSLLTARRSAARREVAPDLAGWSAAYGLSVIAVFFAVSRVRVDTLEIWSDKTNLLRMALTCGLVFTPFLFAGCAIGLALTRYARQANRMYFFDLAGSALGGCVSVWLLARLGSSATVIVAGLLGTLSALVFAGAANTRARVFSAVSVAVAATVAATFVFGDLGRTWEVPFAPGKEFDRYDDLASVERVFSPTAEVEVAPEEPLPPLIGGDFGAAWMRAVDSGGRLLGQDGSAPTMMFRDAARFSEFEFLGATQAASSYLARSASQPDAPGPKVMVIGVGGGADVMVALYNDASHVKAVEINSAMLEVVTERYDDYLGGLFRPGAHDFSDRIELVHGEGRSTLRSSDERFDVIQMSGVDSFTALSTGAYTLSESYLYTVDAVRDFYEHLEEGGYINYSRFILSYPKKPRETLRLVNIAFTALTELGVADPASHIAVYRGRTWASTMIKRGPFTRAEIDALHEFTSRHGFWGLVYDPLAPPGPPTARRHGYDRPALTILMRETRRKVLPGLDYTRQAKLLAFELTEAFRAASAGDHAEKNQRIAALTSHLEGEDGERARTELTERINRLTTDLRRADEQFDRTRADFSTLLRSSPAEREAFIDGYAYDLSPCTDDDPFFFNYYRYASLFDEPEASDANARPYTPNYPVGHVVLLSSLVEITLLAVVLILLPLRFLRREQALAAARGRVFAYFGVLGVGFMFVEIVLMQKMVLFLGHPTYAVSVVLTSVLALAGLGSLLASRIRTVDARALRALAVAIPVLILLEAAAVQILLPAMLGWSFAARVAAVVGLLAPLGLALGMPFPLGLRYVEPRWPELLPWAWAVNAFLSVFSSIFCIVLGMAIGFTQVLIVAAALYAFGLSALARPSDRRARGTHERVSADRPPSPSGEAGVPASTRYAASAPPAHASGPPTPSPPAPGH